jgi:hypothetical protein
MYNTSMGDGTKIKVNLFVIAAENAVALEKDMADLLTKIPAAHRTKLTCYSDKVQRNGRISVNMLQRTLNSFLSLERHVNMHEWVSWMVLFSPIDPDEILRERLGEFYERRVVFDGYFEGGESFRYGALNIGGIGTWFYGEYCILLKEEVSRRPEVTYLRSDSLKTYVLPGPKVDENAIRRDAAPHDNRHCLAVLKHAGEVPSIDEDQWAGMLCSNNNFIEAIFTGELTPDQVEAVRMPMPDYEVRFHFAFESFRDKELSEYDKRFVEEFRVMMLHLRKRNIPLEVI